jgi:hypothetical protein
MIARIARYLAIVFLSLLLGACSQIAKIPTQGVWAGQPVRSSVDSDVARYYLESYLQGQRSQGALDAQIDSLHAQHLQTVPTREALDEMAQNFSVDFASLFLAQRLLDHGCNRAVNQRFAQLVGEGAAPPTNASAYLLLFVPGWDYADNGPVTGADFALPRQLATQYGLENHLVLLPPTGGVQENAEVVAITVRQHSASGKKILLAGASSGGPAIHLALGELLSAKEASAVKAWLNLGGILQGSPLVDSFQTWPRRWLFNAVAWYKGWSHAALLSMSTQASRPRFARLKLPADLLVINYLGIPLSGQITHLAAGNYPLLRTHGPNDGIALLTDMLAPSGPTVLALGRDHFFAEDPQIRQKTVALMRLLMERVEQGGAGGC